MSLVLASCGSEIVITGEDHWKLPAFMTSHLPKHIQFFQSILKGFIFHSCIGKKVDSNYNSSVYKLTFHEEKQYVRCDQYGLN